MNNKVTLEQILETLRVAWERGYAHTIAASITAASITAASTIAASITAVSTTAASTTAV